MFRIHIMMYTLLAGWPCQMTLASECNNTTVHMGGANLKNLVSLLHPSKAMTTMTCKILFVGREGYMKGKKAFIFGVTFFFFFFGEIFRYLSSEKRACIF